MGRNRGKFPMQFIANDKSRKITFLKRKINLEKKLHELTTLCDVEASMVCYRSDGEVSIWPKQENNFESVINRYNGLTKKKKVNCDDDNMRLNELSREGLSSLVSLLDEKLERVREKKEELLKSVNSQRAEVVDGEMISASDQMIHDVATMPSSSNVNVGGDFLWNNFDFDDLIDSDFSHVDQSMNYESQPKAMPSNSNNVGGDFLWNYTDFDDLIDSDVDQSMSYESQPQPLQVMPTFGIEHQMHQTCGGLIY